MMSVEPLIEELSVRATKEKMDEAFRAANDKRINAGAIYTATVVSKKPGTRNPKVVLG